MNGSSDLELLGTLNSQQFPVIPPIAALSGQRGVPDGFFAKK